MDNIISAISLLDAVYANMNQISLVGIENQARFTDCANAIRTVSQTLGKFLQEAQEPVALQENGTAKKLINQEEVNGR